ncbi:Calmodulin binding protein-like [Macleaya cordata]|uniref:Calmodulin binding protein-like n=1 Tax=Macleaya cordata TaxID=56857 RepID=A0A200R2D8_MACCD|nr:Calmodulin binding protein-like [Macleaya cordata]
MVTKRHSNEDDGLEEEDGRQGSSKRQHTLETALWDATGGSSMQEFVRMLLNCVRKVVREELEGQIPPCVQSSHRPSMNQIEASGSRGWRLHFRNRLPNVLFTGCRIVAEDNVPIEVVILDANSEIVRAGPLSSIKIEILVLDGDFGTNGQEVWSAEAFDESVIREREGKRPLVTGEVSITLKDGVGYLADITVTDNSSWVRSGKFKLGARVARSIYNKERIIEARSGAFIVRDHRGQGYQKHHPPSLNDEVWRLVKIRKDGVFHKRLASKGIETVQDFLRLFITDASSLRSTFASGMSSKKWEAIIRHAKDCVLDNRTYMYSAVPPLVIIFFNSIYEVIGAIFDGQNYLGLRDFTTSQMNLVDSYKQHAYQHLNEMVEINVPPANVPPIALPFEAASIPEPTLDVQLPNFQTTHQDQLATHLGLNTSSNSLAHVFDDHCQLPDFAVMAACHPTHEFFQFQRNSEGSSNGNVTYGNEWVLGEPSGHVGTNEHFTGDFNFSQVQTPICIPVTATWGQGNELHLTPGYETGFDFLSSTPDVSLHINRNWKSKTGWFKIRAAVRFLCQKKRARLLQLHC